jgi:hypothetical protein
MSNQKLQLQSRITNESQYQFGDRSYTATEQRWQSTINMMEKSSTEQRNFQKREITVSTRSSPTDKSKAHLEAVCRDTHRQVYQEVLPTSQKYAERQVYQVDQDSTKATCRERNHEVDQMVTEADFQRRLPSQCHLPKTTGCTIYSTEHAEALHRAQTALARLNLVSITIFREAHLLDVNE